MKYWKAAASALLLVCFTNTGFAHHSPFLYYDPTTTLEFEGEITGYRWRNPHAALLLSVRDEDGEEVIWTLETNAISMLKRMGITQDTVEVGDRVRVAGWPSKDESADLIFITNMLKPSGEEIVFDAGTPLRWSEERVGNSAALLATEDMLEANRYTDIFHVWTTSLAAGPVNLLFENYAFELTDEGKAAQAEFDMFDHPILGTCVYKGMPTIMEQPYPMQFAQSENLILMHMEEGNSVRTFDMRPDADYSGREPTNMGYSVGRWEDGDLIVTTTGVSWNWVDLTGVPMTPEAVITEVFSPSEDGNRLDYEMRIEEPGVFAEVPVFTKSWLAVPGETVDAYNCEAAVAETGES